MPDYRLDVTNTVPPYAYGAVGDGVTDCTAAFEQALEDAGNLGRSVYVPKGFYLLQSTSALQVKVWAGKQVRLEGDGVYFSVLRFGAGSATADGVLVEAGGTLVMRDCSTEESGVPTPFAAVRVASGATSFRATRCRFVGQHGLKTDGGAFAVDLVDCVFSTTQHLDAQAASSGGRLHASGCTFSSTSSDAIRVRDVVALRAVACRFTQSSSPGGYGVATPTLGGSAPSYSLIEACHFDANCPRGFEANGLVPMQVAGCAFDTGANGVSGTLRGRTMILGSTFRAASVPVNAALDEPVTPTDSEVRALACTFSGAWQVAAANRPGGATKLWTFLRCRFANGHVLGAPNVRSPSGELALLECEFPNVVTAGDHVLAEKGDVRVAGCRFDGRPLHLVAGGGELRATLWSSSFLGANTLKVEPLTSPYQVRLYGADNTFATAALSFAGTATRVKGALRPRSGRGADVAATTTMDISASEDTLKTVVWTGPVQRMRPGAHDEGARLFQGPWYVIAGTAVDFSIVLVLAAGYFDYAVSGPSTVGEVRVFLVDGATARWRELR